MQIQEIRTELLTHHPDNPRTGYGDIKELTESVREKGILQPLTVVKNGVKYYNVIAGNRRLEAAMAAGLETCPCIVSDIDDEDQDTGPSEYELRREAQAKLGKEGETFRKLHIEFMEKADHLPAEAIIKWLICLYADDDDLNAGAYKATYASFQQEKYEVVSGREYANVLKEEGNRLLREATMLIYSALETDRCPYTNWNGEWTADERADDLYAFLEQLGYRMSSSERFIQCGTHTAFLKTDEDDE